jgi:hypothetical protein
VVEGAQSDLVRNEAMKISRENLGTKSGAHKKLIKRGPMISTPATQASKVGTEMTDQGTSNKESILTRGSMRTERGLTGRSKN